MSLQRSYINISISVDGETEWVAEDQAASK